MKEKLVKVKENSIKGVILNVLAIVRYVKYAAWATIMYLIMLLFLLGCCAYDGFQHGQDVWMMWYEEQGNVFYGLSMLSMFFCILVHFGIFWLYRFADGAGKVILGIVVSAGCGLASIKYMGAKGGAFAALPDVGSMGWILFDLVCVLCLCSMISVALRERIAVDAMPVAEQAKIIPEEKEKDYEGKNEDIYY